MELFISFLSGVAFYLNWSLWNYLFQFKDAGGFQSLVGGKTTEMQRIDVNERIIGLERLNPTPRPTTYVSRPRDVQLFRNFLSTIPENIYR